ncbi:helix-turn-helix domain-containing protein [Paenibacillus wenxiniae]|uniref:Helix-turn-helix domain-containing protein n=1 Tax=Paenibacillus wenxiniae TaxID=1636843 RepID=A0ABW4RGY0_9BACL
MSRVSLGRCLLRDHLRSRKMSQAEFARRLDINKRMVSHYCNNEREMPLDVLYGASIILDIPMDQFYEFEFGNQQ